MRKCSDPTHSKPQIGTGSGEDRSLAKVGSRDREEAAVLGCCMGEVTATNVGTDSISTTEAAQISERSAANSVPATTRS